MIQSMTGFGSSEKGGFRVEVRSLNHRFLEMSVKLPPPLYVHEMALREAVKERFRRGKVDVFVSASGAGKMSVRLNAGTAGEILASLRELKEGLYLPGEITLDTLLNWKELLMGEEASYDTGPLFEAFGEALSRLEEMRLREGRTLAGEITTRVEAIESLNAGIDALCPSVMEAQREKYRERLGSLLAEAGLEEARLLQEAAAAAEKTDISEEVSRIKSHLAQMKRALGGDGAIGRKLDFLLQELQRESNTIASKTEDSRVLHMVIDMKTEIERAREQAQNIQ